jgi:ElaB/YqjD/DUF883 family membrane-anchored ribosome-binding protein
MTTEQPKDPEDALQQGEAAASAAVTHAMQTVQKAMEELAALLGEESTATMDALKQAKQAASENLADAREMGRAGVAELSESVRRNPLAWLAGAVGVGLIVGLWRNRAHRP